LVEFLIFARVNSGENLVFLPSEQVSPKREYQSFYLGSASYVAQAMSLRFEHE